MFYLNQLCSFRLPKIISGHSQVADASLIFVSFEEKKICVDCITTVDTECVSQESVATNFIGLDDDSDSLLIRDFC